jgi:hypothetical protein
VGGTSDKVEPDQLVLALSLGLVATRGGRRLVIISVIIEVTEGGEEGVLLGLDLFEALLLECLLVKYSL